MNATNLIVGALRFAGLDRLAYARRIVMSILAPVATALLLAPALLPAQGGATGTITGRIFNQANGEYVRDAEVRIAGTNLTASTETGGYYRLVNVPVGTTTVLVSYPGVKGLSAEVTVTAGEAATQDFILSSSDTTTIQLETFKVTTEREGNAKALAQQRKSMTVGRSVASDTFGDVTEGNVGEFLKFLPGIELEYVEADTRGPRIGGMSPEYAGVSIDGMKLASADAFVQYGSTENGSTGSATRSFGFEQISINSIESIEINRVTGADVDADSPAGNINLKTKRAFDRKGRYVTWNVGTVLNSEEFKLGKSIGPSDRESQKAKPNYSLSYSDVFFNNRLGILASLSESNLYAEQYRADHTYNRTPIGTDTRPQVLTSINFKDGPKWTMRRALSVAGDFKASEDLTLSLTTTFNQYDGRFYNRTLAFQAAANNTGATTGRQTVAGDGILSYGTTSASTAASRLVTPGGGNGVKQTDTFTIVPKFEYQWGDRIRLDGAFAYSVSENEYVNLESGTAANAAVNNLQGISFTATRSSPLLADWQITQTGGTDWTDPTAYKNPRLSDDGRYARNEIYQGELNATYTTAFTLPTFFKFGGKVRELGYESDQLSPLLLWSYIGPGGNNLNGFNPTTGAPLLTTTGDWSAYTSPFIFNMGQTGANFTSLSGAGAPRFSHRDDIADLFHTNPEYFVNAATTANYETATYLNHRDYLETISAVYSMFNTKAGKWRFQGGVRYELTEKESKEFDPLTNSEVAAAGYSVASRAGIDYKYNSQPRITRTGDYHNYFPSFSAKWDISPSLQLDLGWGKGIKRPDIDKINGVFRINEDALEITAPNPNLLPELSEKYAAALSYFFGKDNSSNNVQLVISEIEIKNLARGTDFTSDEFGNTDPDYANYTFITNNSDGPPVTFRSMELSYLQYLTFLPRFFQGTSVNLAYTRTYATERIPGLSPHTFKGGIQWSYKRVALNFSGVWLDEAPTTNTVGRFRRQNVKFDIGGSVRLSNRLQLYFSGRNIFETPHRIFDTIGGHPKVLSRLENYGSNWAFGVRGSF
jgi:iron complex outermembrane receptor protein